MYFSFEARPKIWLYNNWFGGSYIAELRDYTNCNRYKRTQYQKYSIHYNILGIILTDKFSYILFLFSICDVLSKENDIFRSHLVVLHL